MRKAPKDFPIWSDADTYAQYAVLYQNGQKRIKLIGDTVSFLTPPARTNWPLCGRDGNVGTRYGAKSIDCTDALFSVDLTNMQIAGKANAHFDAFATKIRKMDTEFFEFVFQNQAELLGRKLDRESFKTAHKHNLSIKAKHDLDGTHTCDSFPLKCPMRQYNEYGVQADFKLPICKNATVDPTLTVNPGDVVSVTAYLKGAYCSDTMGFGLQWHFTAVERHATAQEAGMYDPPVSHVPAFADVPDFAELCGFLGQFVSD